MVYYDGGPENYAGLSGQGSKVAPVENVPPRPQWGYGGDPHGYPRAAQDGKDQAIDFLNGARRHRLRRPGRLLLLERLDRPLSEQQHLKERPGNRPAFSLHAIVDWSHVSFHGKDSANVPYCDHRRIDDEDGDQTLRRQGRLGRRNIRSFLAIRRGICMRREGAN